ncbi:retrovirus-related pol polyprotein from transposon 17.6 [Tanacetum coccineum]|uniref:Retrovirus-related pol polyprotein from transposon 17.6 n=1 Tax=Tanacetum coccineum TaxID=301880 RepID=A0ABQ4YDC4_9ASTR
MTKALILSLPYFNEEFFIETNASGYGIGAVLQQSGHPIAFLSKTLAPKHQLLSAYKKELLELCYHYRNEESKWLPKLLGFDSKIDYKNGKDNVMADAISRVQRQWELFALLTDVTSNEFMDAISLLRSNDPLLSHLSRNCPTWKVRNKSYFREKMLWVAKEEQDAYEVEHGEIAEIPSNDTYAYKVTKDFFNHVFYATDNESISDQDELIHDNKKSMAQVDEVRTSGQGLTCDNSQVVDSSFDNKHESTDFD